MDNPIENEAEMKELKYEESFASTESAEPKDEMSMSMKDQDTMISMIVLLLACAALAVLAHVFV